MRYTPEQVLERLRILGYARSAEPFTAEELADGRHWKLEES
jgi:hypothetical protein